ncbi:ExeM/NucH family extracellular endonuclease [Telluribacter sp.]|jgi:hypothetical protein|uniref:ExeM/NucH family extracellular endonuclease n=1 Tax=Telluribacter sp. TaxID=1978767 RepID=UPI002E135E94|nr:ExeM/NucH family extracellular endonuclease [Telluribacter sp.]
MLKNLQIRFKLLFCLLMLAMAGSAWAQAPTELFFSEYIEGSSNNKALEIYNGTGNTIDLATEGYNVQMYFNGSSSVGLTINLTGTITNGNVFVLAHSSASLAILAKANQTNGAGWYNGDDAIVLRKGSTIVDVIGQIGFDPGTEWGSGLASTADNTLRRNATTCGGDIDGSNPFDPSNQWEGFANDTFNGLESHSATCATSTTPALSINDISLNEGNSGTVNFNFIVSLSSPAPAGGVTFDIATTDGTATSANDYVSQTLTGQTIPAGSSTYTFTVQVIGDVTAEPNETFLVSVINVTGATVSDGQGQGTIVNDDIAIVYVHDIQGSGTTSLLTGATVIIEGIVTRTFPGSSKLNGFFVQEEDNDADLDPATSEGIFVFDPTGKFSGSTGDKVRVNGKVAEFTSGASSLTQLTSLTSVVIVGTDALPAVVEVKLPVANVSDLERYEGMLVNMSATEGNLAVTEYFQLGRFGQVVLSAAGASNIAGTDARLDQFTQFYTPSVSGYSAYREEVAKRKIILDDGSSRQNPDPIIFGRGGQPLSATNTLRGGDEVASVTAILDHRLEGYRLQTTTGIDFIPANPRPATPPAVGGTLRVAGFNLLNYFNGDGLGGGFPTSRGADNLAEFNRQRTKTIKAIVEAGVDIFAFNEMENDGYESTSAIQDLVNGVNDVLGAGTFAFINPGTSTGTDAITVAMIYKPASVTPVGAAAVIPSSFGTGSFDIVGRKPLAQTFRENATGAEFTVVTNHWKSKGSSSGGAGDADAGDGQGASNGTRTRQAQDLATWLATHPTGTTDADYLILGDLNAYAMEDPLITLQQAGYSNLVPNTTYSYVFDGFVGALDHALGNSSITQQVTGATKWHINADEPGVLDYNVEFKSEAQKVSLYNADPFRTSDHDPVIVGLKLFSPPVATAIANQTATAGIAFSLDITTGFSDPENETLTYTATGLPNGITLMNGVIMGMPTTVGESTVTITATDPSNLSASTSFTFTVLQGPFKMLAPDYTCGTGRLTIRTIAGNGSPIEYQVPSVSNGWLPQDTYSLESKHLNRALKLRARQRSSDGKGFVEVELSFTPTVCATDAAARTGLAESETIRELTLSVLGNPVTEVVTLDVRGAKGQPLQVQLMDLQGRIIQTRQIENAAEVEHHTFDVRRVGVGMLLLQVSTSQQQKVVKIVKN